MKLHTASELLQSTPAIPSADALTIMKRIWKATDIDEAGCWNWQLGVTAQGYGQIQVRRICKTPLMIHRLSYWLFYGAIPTMLYVCHSCDNRRCWNPRHLWLGTNSDNIHDMWQKNRQRIVSLTGEKHWTRRKPHLVQRGERHRQARLNTQQVLAIRRQLQAGATEPQVARQFNVSRSTIAAIKHKRIWQHV